MTLQITCITTDGDQRTLPATAGMTLMETLRDAGIPEIEAECGGCCSCATCHVHLAPDWASKLPQVSAAEQDMLEFAEGYAEGTSRLSCQITLTQALNGLVVKAVKP